MTGTRVLLFGLMIATAACSETNTQPSSSSPNTIKFTADLLPSNEVPAVSNADASGRGTATITFVITREGDGAITAATVTFDVTLSGFPAGTRLTGAHIHEAPAGSNGGVKVQTSLASGEVTLTSGSGGFSRTFAAPADVTQGIINNPAGYYFNVHTQLTPGGAVRGQLVRQ